MPPGTEVAPGPSDTPTFPTGSSPPVAITDLLDRVPIPARRPAPPPAAGPGGRPLPERPFSVELPPVERVGISLDPLAEGAGVPVPEEDRPAARPTDAPAASSPARPAPRAARPPLPSYAVAAIGGLTLLSLALAVALVVAARATPAAAAPSAATPAVPVSAAPTPSFGSDPAPIPVDLITRLEDASEEPLDVELARLLDAVQHGFGGRSAVLEPTLRSYVYRMSSRFEWNPDTFRVAVTAPDPDLAAARGELLEHVFEGAVAQGRLQVGTGVGPHALTLVSD